MPFSETFNIIQKVILIPDLWICCGVNFSLVNKIIYNCEGYKGILIIDNDK